MKKYLLLLCFFLLPFWIIGQQSDYVDVTKKDTVTVNIIAKDKLQTITNNHLQTELLKVVTSRLSVDSALINGTTELTSALTNYVNTVEEHTRSSTTKDCQWCLITNLFNYSPDDVTHSIRVERWLNFTALIIGLVYFFWSFWDSDFGLRKWSAQGVAVKLIFTISLTVLFYLSSLKLLTLLFNGDYYVIKELIKMYS